MVVKVLLINFYGFVLIFNIILQLQLRVAYRFLRNIGNADCNIVYYIKEDFYGD